MKPEAHVPVAEYAHEHPVLKNPGETRMLDHLPQLDGVRAIAVSMVLWSHLMPDSQKFRGLPPWGAVGVAIFFVLSGFLITRILLNCKLKIADKRAGFWGSFKQFYVRRFLRIFPLYYGVLLVLYAINATNFRARYLYSFLYFTNYRFAYGRPTDTEIWVRHNVFGQTMKAIHRMHWSTGSAIERHLWSLSVEEQFYIFWPILILLCPRRLLLPLILLTMAVGPVWRTHNYFVGLEVHEWMTPACLDLLGAGALLALLSLPRFGLSRWRDGFVQLCGLIGVPAMIAYMAQRWFPTTMVHGHPAAYSYDWLDYGGAVYPMTALASIWLIGTAARGFRGPIGWLLTCPPAVYLGRVSYGVYVVHLMMPNLLTHFFPKLLTRNAAGEITRYWWHTALYVAVSIGVASLTWFFYEAPINKLKRYFEYDRTASAKLPTSAAAA